MAFTFDEDYFKEEVKQGFTITSTMKRCHAADLRVLNEIERLGDKYGFDYFAYWGTLLGAVRDKGIIPWDDDIDIGMTRENFNKFVACADELSDTIHIIGKDTKNYPFVGMYRVVTTEHIMLTDEFLEKNYFFPMLAGVDLYVFDYIPRDKKTFDTICEFLQITLDAADLCLKDPTAKDLPQKILNVTNFIGVPLDAKSDKSIVWQLQRFYEIAASLTTDEEADEMGLYNHIMYHDKGLRFPKEIFNETIDVPFETGTIKILKNYESSLVHRFGLGYMTPRIERGMHDYPYYKKQLQVIMDYCKENNDFSIIKKCQLESEMKLYDIE